MSYDCYMTIDTGGEWPADVCDIGNMTSNVSGMWAKALGFPLADMEGWTGDVVGKHVHRAIAAIADPETRHEYEAMNPSNGWGSVGAAEKYLHSILDACRKHPKAKLRISR